MILRFLISALVLGCQLWSGSSARAQSAAAADKLPLGHWEGDYKEALRVCLDLQSGERILVTFHDHKFRNPVVVEGSYSAVNKGGSQLELTVKVERVVTKEIGPCRKYWVQMDLKSYEGLGVKVRPGSNLKLRLTASCADRTSMMKLCFVDEASGKLGVCQQLRSPSSRQCQPAPPKALDDILPPERPRAPSDPSYPDL